MNRLQAQHQAQRLRELAASVHSCITASRETGEPEQRFGLLAAAEQLAGELRELAWSHSETARAQGNELASIEGNATAALRFIEQGKIHGPGDNASVRLRMIREKAARVIRPPCARIAPALIAAFNADPSDATASAVYSALAAAGYPIDHDASLVAADDTSGDLMILDDDREATLTIRANGTVWEAKQ
ncbi:hypothetical protein [Thiorhodovibrio frisius]|uniref:Uncharacterized protein n=1 Tax=Thiorhodovibrio frisius TaxID=631362 RepID=H8Z5F5_9GAMM|nr:hypothetical protein [Thiorhodovibrio frisius]EIC19501.1 hypothetical protein Thi970DRAFT_03079 [Thiorhodovibrio frisius]WPL20536.1 hypothetical protein Thiofri_00635 [Thiorhodovibrio frisius]